MISDLLRCKISITRPGEDYQIDQNTLSSFYENCFSAMNGLKVTIGGAMEDDIYAKKLQPKHAILTWQNSTLCVEAHGEMQIAWEASASSSVAGLNQKTSMLQTIRPGQTIKHKIELNEITNSFLWKIAFPDKTVLKGSFHLEEVDISPESLAHLEARYGVLQLLQIGEFCLIFKTQKNRILKILKTALVKHRPSLTRFINAARKSQVLPHHAFLKMYGIVYECKFPLCYVITEYCEGQTLQNYLAGKSVLPLAEAATIVSALADTLAVLHDHKSCYRSLNPRNILLRPDGSVRVTGFFLIKSEEWHMTLATSQMVIPKFTAPEQALDPSTVDIAADIFSLGAIFYTMIGGEAPYNFNNPAQYKKFIAEEKRLKAQEIQDIVPHLPLAVCQLIAQMLAWKKQDRPSIAELPSRLAQVVQAKHDLLDGLEQKFGSLEALDALESENDPALPGTPTKPSKDDKFSTSFVAALDQQDQPPQPTGETARDYSIEVVSSTYGNEPKQYTFPIGATIIIGREGDIALQGPKVSRRHAQVSITAEGCWLKDLGSKNGVSILGRKIACEKIEPGTKFSIGDIVLLLRQVYSSLTSMLENADIEITEDKLSSVSELKIISIGEEIAISHDQPGSLEDTLDLDEPPKLPTGALPKAPTGALPKPPTGAIPKPPTGSLPKPPSVKPKAKPAKPAPAVAKPVFRKLTIGFGAVVLLILLVWFWPSPATTDVVPDKSKNTPPTNPDNTTAVYNPPVTKLTEQPKKLQVAGKIMDVQEFDGHIQYFIILAGGDNAAEQAIEFPSNFGDEEAQAIRAAYKKGEMVKVTGVPAKLARGRIALAAGKITTDYVQVHTIQIDGNVFKAK